MKKLVYGLFTLVAFSFIVPDTSFAAQNPPHHGKRHALKAKIVEKARKHNVKGRVKAKVKQKAEEKASMAQ